MERELRFASASNFYASETGERDHAQLCTWKHHCVDSIQNYLGLAAVQMKQIKAGFFPRKRKP